jgi:hypothetical protein
LGAGESVEKKRESPQLPHFPKASEIYDGT